MTLPRRWPLWVLYAVLATGTVFAVLIWARLFAEHGMKAVVALAAGAVSVMAFEAARRYLPKQVFLWINRAVAVATVVSAIVLLVVMGPHPLALSVMVIAVLGAAIEVRDWRKQGADRTA